MIEAASPVTRVLVVGPSGAGKSTLARLLGNILGTHVVHLDQLYWRPGWTEPPPDEFRAAVLAAAGGPAWVIDGNYFSNGAGAERLAACDTIVILDFPRRVCLWQVAKRIAGSYGRVRPDLAEGCPEQIDLGFLRWVWDADRCSLQPPRGWRLCCRASGGGGRRGWGSGRGQPPAAASRSLKTASATAKPWIAVGNPA